MTVMDFDFKEQSIDPELMALCTRIVESQARYKEWFDSLSPEEQAKAREKQIEAMTNFVMYGPGGEDRGSELHPRPLATRDS